MLISSRCGRDQLILALLLGSMAAQRRAFVHTVWMSLMRVWVGEGTQVRQAETAPSSTVSRIGRTLGSFFGAEDLGHLSLFMLAPIQIQQHSLRNMHMQFNRLELIMLAGVLKYYNNANYLPKFSS